MEDLDKAFNKFWKPLVKDVGLRDIVETSEIKAFIRQREKDLLYSLEDMVRQFAYAGSYRKKPAYITGGLSALEYAFRVLGWKEPHPCPENTCEWKGCNKWANCGTPYKKGYLRCCGEHFKKARELSNE